MALMTVLVFVPESSVMALMTAMPMIGLKTEKYVVSMTVYIRGVQDSLDDCDDRVLPDHRR
jgi:hypothetical protein